jgi:hypothetical protein
MTPSFDCVAKLIWNVKVVIFVGQSWKPKVPHCPRDLTVSQSNHFRVIMMNLIPQTMTRIEKSPKWTGHVCPKMALELKVNAHQSGGDSPSPTSNINIQIGRIF